MKTIGIVAEYNPFHNGHKALISHAKQSGYSHCVAVMSGNFTQRNEPAITEKRVRAHAALLSGADLIIELPTAYATATAQLFSKGAVSLLKDTGVVDSLCFGSELGSTDKLAQVAALLDKNDFSVNLSKFLEQGMTFAKARSMAIGSILGEEFAEIASSPNNLLGIEYIHATKKLDWVVDFLTIPRIKVDHHSQTPEDTFASASYLRSATNLDTIKNYVPASAFELYGQAFQNKLYPSDFDRLEGAIISYLRRLSVAELKNLSDFSEGLEHRFFNAVRSSTNLSELTENLKTKRYPLSRVRRLILTAFLGIEQRHLEITPPYLRILGFNTKGRELLHMMKETASLPFSHSLSELSKLSPNALDFAKMEAFATDQYTLTLPQKLPCGYDYVTPAVFVR